MRHNREVTATPSQAMPRDYRFWIDHSVRFRDLDTLRHVNHTIYFVYAEQARLEYYRQILRLDLMTELAFLMRDIRCSFLAAAEFGDALRIGFRMEWMKRSSSGFSFVIERADGQRLADGEGVQVYVDLVTRRPAPLPQGLRTRVLSHDADVIDYGTEDLAP